MAISSGYLELKKEDIKLEPDYKQKAAYLEINILKAYFNESHTLHHTFNWDEVYTSTEYRF